ncbi:rab-GTPase-TBC domain-containing protein [Phthorimaea operculella]|nr:rab-GTPase-TBC domain-containing protein [Phthorimaea operculella]
MRFTQLQYEVSSIETSGELDRSRLNLPLSLSSLLPSPLSSAPAPPSPSEPDSDGDEPLLSGTGEVSKDCHEDVLVNWAQVLRSWTGPRPRALNTLVRVGVPEALRGEVWLRLAGVDQNDKLMETYRTLIMRVGVPEALRGEVWLRLAGVDQNDKLMETYRTLISKVSYASASGCARGFTREVWLRLAGVDQNDKLMETYRTLISKVSYASASGCARGFTREVWLRLAGVDQNDKLMETYRTLISKVSYASASGCARGFTREVWLRLAGVDQNDKLMETYRTLISKVSYASASGCARGFTREVWLRLAGVDQNDKLMETYRTLIMRVGVPEALRGEVWLRLAGVDQNDKLMETYRTLISKVSYASASGCARGFTREVWLRLAGVDQNDKLMETYRTLISKVSYASASGCARGFTREVWLRLAGVDQNDKLMETYRTLISKVSYASASGCARGFTREVWLRLAGVDQNDKLMETYRTLISKVSYASASGCARGFTREVWLRLAGVDQNDKLMETYRTLISKVSYASASGCARGFTREVWLRLAGVDQNDKLMETYRTLISKVSYASASGCARGFTREVWLRLAGVDQNDKLMETYRTLISKDCPFEAVIQRDIARTFPAHDFFREAGGLGQDSLLRMARAYAVYDVEVGYCQGLSFLAATLLLHMPEEQAFCLLVRLMYGQEYGLRELYKDGFEALYMRLHQLDRLMEEQLSDLRAHFQELGIEPHMFASQWFLTVFTARFPLPLVYHILDVFLLQGIDTLFQVAMALLSRSRKDLLQLDFEGVHKYFRVTLPKRCRAEETSKQIVKLACSIKVKRLARYQQEYEKFMKETAEKEKINVELERLKQINLQLQQDKKLLEAQLKESRAAVEEAKKQTGHYEAVTRDYREICARLDKQLHVMQDYVKGCPACSDKMQQRDNRQGKLTVDEAKKKDNKLVTRDYREICARLDKQLHVMQDYVKGCPACSDKMQQRDNRQGELTVEEVQKEGQQNRILGLTVEEANKQTGHYEAVTRDYREICARLDKQLHVMQDYVKGCPACSDKMQQRDNRQESEQKDEDKMEGASDTEARLRQRVRDLELELAQVKLAHVQAQCSNQELSHQLNSALNEMQAAMNQKQTDTPWLVRTLGSIMEAAQNRPSFQTYLPNMTQEPQSPTLRKQGSFSSHSNSPGVNHRSPGVNNRSPATHQRRDSEPYSPDVVRRKKDINTKRHSLLLESAAKETKELNRRSHDVTNAAIVKNLSMG